ncbi:MAG: phosphatidylserine/phosphatidylglycerophosphate/cardiolipin synthase family protein [Pseudomonadota bacterium]
MKTDILVGSERFWARLKQDIADARQSVRIQAMTFEADSVGLDVYDALAQSPAPAKHLCVDHFSNFVISDSFIHGPRRLFDRGFCREVQRTKQIFRDASKRGIDLTFTNPLGPLFYKYPHRNHKKLMLIDNDVAYIGGINFSEHNFEWHDMMLRIECPDVAGFLQSDFDQTVSGQNQSRKMCFGDMDLYCLNGAASHALYEDIFSVIRAATKSIQIVSPYITAPFLDVIGQQALAGVSVKIISPAANNKSLLKHYLQHQRAKYPFEILMYEGAMSHLKAILVDDDILMLGSTNFDFASYFLEQEYCAVIRHADTVAQFKTKVLNDALAASVPYRPDGRHLSQLRSRVILGIAIQYCKFVSRRIYKAA